MYSIVDDILHVAKCNLGKVKIHPMLGSSFTKFVGGGRGSKGAYTCMCFLLYWGCITCTVFFPFPAIASVIGKYNFQSTLSGAWRWSVEVAMETLYLTFLACYTS